MFVGFEGSKQVQLLLLHLKASASIVLKLTHLEKYLKGWKTAVPLPTKPYASRIHKV